MRIAAALLAVLMVSCNWETPTQPTSSSAPSQAAADLGDLEMIPAEVTVAAGQTVDVVIRGPWTYPLGVGFGTTNKQVAQVTGGIPAGAAEGVAHITGLVSGESQAVCIVYNFGRPPGMRTTGRIVVGAGPHPRRRTVH
jgi:hypothetical protein